MADDILLPSPNFVMILVPCTESIRSSILGIYLYNAIHCSEYATRPCPSPLLEKLLDEPMVSSHYPTQSSMYAI
jgi:hypothetical protein